MADIEHLSSDRRARIEAAADLSALEAARVAALEAAELEWRR